MKRTRFIMAMILSAAMIAAFLSSCASNSYSLIMYETRERMQDELSFDMREIEGIEDVIGYAAADSELGEISYGVMDEYGNSARLRLRMATIKYAENYEKHVSGGMTGSLGEPVKSERLGSANVSYYESGSTAAASWTLGDYAYAIILKFDDQSLKASQDDVYNYVLAVISLGL